MPDTNSTPHSRSATLEQIEDRSSNTSENFTIGDIIAARFDRRTLMKHALGIAAIGALAPHLPPLAQSAAAAQTPFNFEELNIGEDETHHVAPGYDAHVLIRWGDAVLNGAPLFDAHAQKADAQAMQFGYNNDYLGYFPMPGKVPGAANPSAHGLLVVNHEYTNAELMFAGLKRGKSGRADPDTLSAEQAAIEMAAHGGSVIEIRRDASGWKVVPDSRFARRITATTPIEISGPAAGHARLQTKADAAGKHVLGMLNNCAGGTTPWGTWLTCEENFNYYFSGQLTQDHSEARNHKRFGIPTRASAWGRFDDRFDITLSPHEPNRFGWVVEIDPFDPQSVPKKRTALGRLKHEGAAGIVNSDGRYVIYMGDDQRFEYVYRFITTAKVDAANPTANRDILDAGTLDVARFNADGTLIWLPLVHGNAPLDAANGFASQADVLIEARRAADLLGATKMDRPEDVEASPKTGKVYLSLTNNSQRKPEQIDPANPRAPNLYGHIIEMVPPNGDHAAAEFRWDILVRCGDPQNPAIGATFSTATSANGWFGMPDNVAVDHQGRLWVATDGNSQAKTGRADGIWALETEGAGRGTARHFFRVPVGAEMCGPCFTPDDETLFVAVQHPGEVTTTSNDAALGTFENPSTRWPDFKPDMPPRPSVIAITRKGGGKIGV